MDFGANVPGRGAIGNRDAITALARHAEALGFHYLSTSDHIVQPRDIGSVYPYNEAGRYQGTGEHMEQLALLMFLAAVTEKIRLLTSVMVVPHRPPYQAAKTIATIDVLSGGRITIGAGAGWMREEFEAIGAPDFDTRGRATDEAIRTFRRLWADQDPKVIFRPKPIQTPLPIWIGGESDAALRRAVRLGDGWYPIGSNPRFPLDSATRYAARVKDLHALAEKAGRDPKSLTLGYSANWYPAAERRASDGARMLMTGSDKDAAEDIAALATLGVRTLVMGFASPSVAEQTAKMERFMAEVAPLVR